MGFEIEYYKLLKYINQIIIGEKIPSNSKIILGLMSGGTNPEIVSNPSNLLVTTESLKAINENTESNESFLKLIGEFFGQDIVEPVKRWLPMITLLLTKSDSKNQSGSGINDINDINLKDFIIPIVVIIFGYLNKDNMGEEKFIALVTICICYCVYLMYTATAKAKALKTSIVSELCPLS